MANAQAHLSSLFDWLLGATFQAVILVLLILVLQAVLRRRLEARWHCALWLIVAVRLALPWAPSSRFSLFNLVPRLTETASPQLAGAPAVGEMPRATTTPPVAAPLPVMPATSVSERAAMNDDQSTMPHQAWASRLPSARRLVEWLWLAAAAALAAWTVLANVRFRAGIRSAIPVNDATALRILRECTVQMGLKSAPRLVETGAVSMPSLYGLIRPCVLMPAGLIANLSAGQLQHVFLHELAHLKRLDTAAALLAAAVQILHWFNPLVWLAFRRMRADREIACDAMALSHLQPDQARAYGETLIRLAEGYGRSPWCPGVAGILEGTNELARRITMISRFNGSHRGSLLTVVALFAILGCTVLTNARTDSRPETATAPVSPDESVVLPEGSYINANGRIVDRIDWPFVNDPPALGKWESVDFVKKIEDFVPGKPHKTGDALFMKGLVLSEGGAASWPFMGWTKGRLMHAGDHTAEQYVIKQIDGSPYLFLEFKSGDYIIAHRKPWYFVFKKLPADSKKFDNPRELFAMDKDRGEAELGPDSKIDEHGNIVDKIDYPFVNDAPAVGKWESVDYVSKIDDFDPGKPRTPADRLFVKGLVFSEGGKANFGFLKWTKGLVLSVPNKTASKYIIKPVRGTDYLFMEWKSGDYVIAHRKPDYYVFKKLPADSSKFHSPRELYAMDAEAPEAKLGPDSHIDKNDRIVDKTDYPFVDDPQAVGTWESVDFVKEPSQFQPGRRRWLGGDLFLKGLAFLSGGRMKPQGHWTWTKGMVLDKSGGIAPRYEIKNMGGASYMFFEWKSGDYSIMHRKPQYYVLKKTSSDPGEAGRVWSKMPSDEEFARDLQAKVAKLDIAKAAVDDVIKVFGEPAQYLWGSEEFKHDKLPDRYIMIYPAGFHVAMYNGRIGELRFERPGLGYVFEGKLKVGSSLEDALRLLGQPTKTVTGEKCTFESGVLYQDMNGRPGWGYYARKDRNVRMFLQDGKIMALYVTRPGS